jgi:hypothetical protein
MHTPKKNRRQDRRCVQTADAVRIPIAAGTGGKTAGAYSYRCGAYADRGRNGGKTAGAYILVL